MQTFVTYLVKRGMEPTQAEDVVQDTLCSIQTHKSYTQILSETKNDAVAFMTAAVRNKATNHFRNEGLRNRVVGSLESQEGSMRDPLDRTDWRTRERSLAECPFCYKDVPRTHYGDLACPHCGTIVGVGIAYSEQVGATDKELVEEMPDFDMQLDVNNALGILTPIERTVVEAFVLRSMSLDDLSLVYDIDRFSLRRMFLHAKGKLKAHLAAYEVHSAPASRETT
jgi:DNA-directed RNA polymerase specialized sigma24 family protein